MNSQLTKNDTYLFQSLCVKKTKLWLKQNISVSVTFPLRRALVNVCCGNSTGQTIVCVGFITTRYPVKQLPGTLVGNCMCVVYGCVRCINNYTLFRQRQLPGTLVAICTCVVYGHVRCIHIHTLFFQIVAGYSSSPLTVAGPVASFSNYLC